MAVRSAARQFAFLNELSVHLGPHIYAVSTELIKIFATENVCSESL